MPTEAPLTILLHRQSEDRLIVYSVLVGDFFVLDLALKERCRRQLLRITDDRVLSSRECAQGILWLHLRRFIYHDEIKLNAAGWQILSDGKRAHHNHVVDLAVTRPNGTRFLISLKWQQVPGTAQEKVPYEVIKRLHSLRENAGLYDKAYIVIGGDGWTPGILQFYVSDEFRSYIREGDRIEILLMNEAIRRANQATL